MTGVLVALGVVGMVCVWFVIPEAEDRVDTMTRDIERRRRLRRTFRDGG